MSSNMEANKELVRSHLASFSTGDLDAAADNYAEDYRSDSGRSAHELKESVWRPFFESFPDLTIEIKRIVSEGDWVLVDCVHTATHEGEFKGIAPTGNAVEYRSSASYRIEDGNIVESYSVSNKLSILRQLGVEIPAD